MSALPNAKLTMGSVYTALSRMADKGWVVASSNVGNDGRLRLFRATAKGKKVLAASPEFYRALVAFEPNPIA